MFRKLQPCVHSTYEFQDRNIVKSAMRDHCNERPTSDKETTVAVTWPYISKH